MWTLQLGKWLRRALLILAAAFVLLVTAALVDGLLVHLPDSAVAPPPAGERIGVIHVHTTAAHGLDGQAELEHRSAGMQAVEAAAREAHLSFVAITDHNVSADRASLGPDPPGLTLIPGEELSTDQGHFVALGISGSWLRPAAGDSGKLLAAAHTAGGITFLAHPYNHLLSWRDWETKDFDGIEIWNEDAAWKGSNALDILTSLFMYPINKDLALARLASTPEQNFTKWDELTAERRVVGICAADAHGGIWLGGGRTLHLPDYVSSFRVARQHIILGPGEGGADPGAAGPEALLEALKKGHSYCALDGLYPAAGFSQTVSSAGAVAEEGDAVAWSAGSSMRVTVPHSSGVPWVRVYRNGREFAETRGWSLVAPLAGPGRYRTEIFLQLPGLTGLRRWVLWIFSNPTYVTTAAH